MTWSSSVSGKNYQMQRVQSALGVGNTEIRRTIYGILNREGVKEIQGLSSEEALLEHLKATMPDLLIVDCKLEGDAVVERIKDIRNHRLGDNPFMVIMVLLDAPQPEEIMAWIQAGVDDVLLQPVSPAQILKRLLGLIENRKPFVVTSDYTGPERRAKPRGGESRVVPMKVPNSLKAKATGAYEVNQLRLDIQSMLTWVNGEKIQRHVEKIAEISGTVLPMLEAGLHGDLLNHKMREMATIAEDLGRRVVDTEHADKVDLFRDLHGLTQRLKGEAHSGEDVQQFQLLLEKIAQSFHRPA
ncbi:response regulator [Magnetospira thiophila]